MTKDIIERPAILIAITDHMKEESLRDILYGIEEEGIPYQIIHFDKGNPVKSSHQAAGKSILSVAIGSDEKDIVLHFKNLKEDHFVYRIKNYQQETNDIKRIFGNNAARLVKGYPFKESERLEVSF